MSCAEQPHQSMRRPDFDELPLRPGDPKGSAWGLWGEDDELGTLNLLIPDVVTWAAREVQLGIVVPLNLPLSTPVRPMNPARKPCSHNLLPKGYANDDELYMNTQASTHWDGLRHYPYQISDNRRYYNGVTEESIVGDVRTSQIGIQRVAQRGIAGRGVLLDWRDFIEQKGLDPSPFTSHAIPLRELQEVAAIQGVSFLPGDILIIRTGWIAKYKSLNSAEKVELAQRQERAFIGVEPSEEMIRWHWDRQFAAVASDTNAYEVSPFQKPWGVACHEVFLSGWGMPIGELWDLEQLATVCREHRKWTFMLSSVPLNLEGGVASPANVQAIL